ncbi:acyltransferase family protein [Undibacterium pigrum]|uniref:Acyltransferase-like protein n=1 Tax=Undibacterium pigrum TaxID=401470 RepID=A0A318J8H1_9BURK|nr:acyltransferase family protein [Undibacterium pigrum]PXX45379.1 acyltransferase-like protein [Undibacterium pigrum]
MSNSSIAVSGLPSQRLYFLDWVRIIAFFLLILYHVGMYYVEWGWHVKSPHANSAIQPLMMMTNPWRLSLLFFISGVASAFMLEKIATGKFLRSRSLRLLLPLIFGMFVVVPPQAYFEVVEKLAYAGSYSEFMQLYLHHYRGFKIEGKVLDLPTWNHLWFVTYLWVYSVLLWFWLAYNPAWFQAARNWLQKQMRGWRILVLPVAYLALVRMGLFSSYPPNNGLVADWYNHACYLFIFTFGALIANSQAFWQELATMRWLALRIAACGWLFLIIYFSFEYDATPQWLIMFQRCIWVCMAWSSIIAACGYAKQYLNFDSPARRYLTQAVFPVYILHQTYIVIMAHSMKPLALPALPEGILLVALTGASCFLSYEIIRRVFFLRPLFGLDLGLTYKPRALSPG